MTPEDDLETIHLELIEDQVFVHPSLRDSVSEADEEALQQQVAQASDPTYIVVWPYRPGDAYGGKPADLLTRLHDTYPEPGLYLSNTEHVVPDRYNDVAIAGRQWGLPGERDGEMAHEITWAVRFGEFPDVASALDRTLELREMDPEDVREIYEELSDARSQAYREANPDVDDGGAGPFVIGGLAIVAAFVLWRVVVSFRKQKHPTPLPESALQRIRAAQNKELLARAQADSQALGELLDELEIEPHDDRSAWQEALDHYAASRRLLDVDDPDPLDVVGALVLTSRGEDALASARAGRAWEPVRTCFLNPLHGRAAREQRIEWEGRAVSVPVCDACRTALRRSQVPDIFDVVRRGQPRHYFETDVEPWASTGYGALDPDLLGALARRARP